MPAETCDHASSRTPIEPDTVDDGPAWSDAEQWLIKGLRRTKVRWQRRDIGQFWQGHLGVWIVLDSPEVVVDSALDRAPQEHAAVVIRVVAFDDSSLSEALRALRFLEPWNKRRAASGLGAVPQGDVVMDGEEVVSAPVSHNTRELPVESIKPNAYNPNTMDTEEFAELVAEVRHLGRLPKPVVVSKASTGWVIVDGEHGWRAARQLGLRTVACEVVEVDSFEAMRQTYKRNQHGHNDPVRLGRMFQLMMNERGRSIRELADEIGVSEGTIRNNLVYAEAADLRNSYAHKAGGGDGELDQEIVSLSVRQVREYVGLPPVIRDEWLDAGADPRALQQASIVRYELAGKATTVCLDGDEEGIDLWQELADTGLAERVLADDFVESAHEAFRLLLFRRQHVAHVPDIDAYLLPVAELCVPSEVVFSLPCRTAGDRTEILVPPDGWRSLLVECSQRAVNQAELVSMVRAAVQLAADDCVEGAVDVTDPRVLLVQRTVREAPEFLRDCELPLADRYAFALLLKSPRGNPDRWCEAACRACQMLVDLRGAVRDHRLHELRPAVMRLLPSPTPADAFEVALDELRHEQTARDRATQLADVEGLSEAIAQRLCPDDPRREALARRLALVPAAELQLLGSAALGWPPDVDLWESSVLGKGPVSR
jgi:ParB/RepB/Spo0J family partition protein